MPARTGRRPATRALPAAEHKLGPTCAGLFAALGIALSAAAPAATPAPAQEQMGDDAPVFVLVTLDTTRADRLGAYGAAGAGTPNLDRLAQRGAVFERAYAATPVTLPSHATLLTGLYPPAHGVRDNGIHALPEEAATLAEVLRDRGFRTGAFVSAAVLARRYGLAQGFEVYDDDLEAGLPKQPRMVAERPADLTVASAHRWLDGLGQADPVFLWAHLFDPHAPYAPPPAFARRFPGRPYEGEIAFADAEIGRLLAHPRLAGAAAAERLLVMVIADHGESLGEHGEASHGMLVYEATLRVPWIVVGRGVRPGARIGEPVSQADLAPTALSLLGASAGGLAVGGDGIDLAPRLRGAAPGSPHSAVGAGGRGAASPNSGAGSRAVYAETLVPFYAYGWSPLRALIEGSWKLIEAPSPELYDLAADPVESRNLHPLDPVRARALEQRLAERFGAPEATPREALASRDADSEARLRSLGYLSGRGAARRAGTRPDPKDLMDVHRGIERAQAHLHARDFERAVGELRAVLTRDPDNLAALEDLALALADQGRFDGAERAIDRALEAAPASARLRLASAQLRGARSDWEGALTQVEAALALDPRDTGALAFRVATLERLGRSDQARAALERALALAPGEPLLEVLHAELVELAAGRTADAEQRLERAAERQPHLAAAWLMLGRVRDSAGEPDAARRALEEGLRYQPLDGALHAELGLLLAATDPPAALRHLREAARLQPRPALATLNALADLLAATGDAPAATAVRARVLERPPASDDDRHQRATALRAVGRIDEAEAEWRTLVGRSPSHAPAWQGLAAIALDRGLHREAAEAAGRAVEIDPALATAWNALAIATEELAGKEAALPLYRRAAAADPEYWQASYNLALVLRDLDRLAEAASSFGAVLAAAPEHAKSHYELGLLLAGPLADPGAARRHLETALRLEPSAARAEAARRALAALPR